MKQNKITLFCGVAVLMLCSACVSIAPGADKLIVNVERVEQEALATFDLVLSTDNANREFFKTNAVPFHAFCEWLRVPGQVGTNTLPRSLGMIRNLENIKQDYRLAKASSNELYTVMATVESFVVQASGWLNIVTNK